MPAHVFRRISFVLGLLGLSAAVSWLHAQPAAPPAPARFQATLRYQIRSARDLHVMQYDALVEHLKALQFEFQPPLAQRPRTDREDPSKNILQGLVPSANALKVLHNFNVASILLSPEGFKLPADSKAPVRIRIELAGGIPLDRQRELGDQTRVLLRDLGFREAAGYDHAGYTGRPFTRLAGTIPAGRLEVLLKDLRTHPAGWFGPRIAMADLPLPLRTLNPIRVVEVLADKEPAIELAIPEVRSPAYLEKISPDLWAIVNDKKMDNKIVRIDVILVGQVHEDDVSVRTLLSTLAPGSFVEGQLGQVVTVQAVAGQVKALAEAAEVSVLRLTRTGRVEIDGAVAAPNADNAKALAQSKMADLHKKGWRGQGVRLAIVDTDFRGWEQMVQQKKLPAKTRLADLTTERNPELYPEPFAGKAGQLGHGTQCALAVALAAPEVELTLIRISDPAPYQIAEVAGLLRGGNFSATLHLRRDELAAAKDSLASQRQAILKDRVEVLEDFSDDSDIMRDFEFMGAVRGWIFSRREWIQQRLTHQRRLEAELRERQLRYVRFVEEIQSLKGITLAVNSLAWNDGFPLGGLSPLSRYFDAPTASMPLWFQPAGNTRGQAWSGLFRDLNGDGVMEFAPPDQPRKKGQWSSEQNFIGWNAHGKEEMADLPEGARIRITMQWREPHDPDYYLRPGEEDLYRKPLAALRLIVLRQRDAQGKTVAADAFELAAVSSEQPQRLEHLPNSSVYEAAAEFTVAKSGRYALRVQRAPSAFWFLIHDAERGRPVFVRVQGQNAVGIRPAGVAALAELEKNWELNLRLFVDVLNGGRGGRPVFADYATDQGTTGLPADSRAVISVGAADFAGKMRSYSATGALPYAELSRRPAILAFDGLDVGPGNAYGSSISAGFAAGTAAVLMSSGVNREQLQKLLQEQSGQLLRIPESR